MSRRPSARFSTRGSARRGLFVLPRAMRNSLELGQRARGATSGNLRSFLPPEDWYNSPDTTTDGYRIVVQQPGNGYTHVVTPEQIQSRLARFPNGMLKGLKVVQLSRMTRKKRSLPCYGMQWGSTIYLYPVESSLIESSSRPPRPAEYHEARLFGGHWIEQPGGWKLVWTKQALRNFYLHNVLIHELGHLVDDRNTNARDRERYAEWFAIEYGHRRRR